MAARVEREAGAEPAAQFHRAWLLAYRAAASPEAVDAGVAFLQSRPRRSTASLPADPQTRQVSPRARRPWRTCATRWSAPTDFCTSIETANQRNRRHVAFHATPFSAASRPSALGGMALAWLLGQDRRRWRCRPSRCSSGRRYDLKPRPPAREPQARR